MKKKLAGTILILLSLGWLFVIPLIPLKANKEIDGSFLTQNHGQYSLIFFGFPSCGTICPPAMRALSNVYTLYNQKYDDHLLDIVFVNLVINTKPEICINYAKSFHKDFVVYHFSKTHLKDTMKKLGVYSFQTQANTQMVEHTGYIFLLEKKRDNKWIIQYVYNDGQRLKSNLFNDLKSLKENL